MMDKIQSMKQHNHKAIWTMIVVNQLFGFLWYSPLMSLSPYLKGRGITLEQMNSSLENMNSDPTPFIYGFFGAVFTCYLISWIVVKLQTNDFKSGVVLGFFLFMGLVFPSIATHYKFLAIDDSVLWIDLGMSFVLTLLTGGILALWKKKNYR